MTPLPAVAAGLSSGLTYLAAENVAANGPDFTGIALLVSAIAGLISAITAMVIALRRKPTDPAVVELLQKLAEKDSP